MILPDADPTTDKGRVTYTWTIEDVAPGTYTVTEDKASAKVGGYTLTVSGDDGASKDMTDDGVAFSITNKYSKGGGGGSSGGGSLNSRDHFAYVEGYPDGTVQPQGNITRAETVTMIYRLLTATRRDAIFTSQNSFSDVEAADWYNKAVSSMAKGGYVEGYPDGTFQGNNAITRAEFVTMMVRFLDEKPTGEMPFSDVDDTNWAKDYIIAAAYSGWIDGYPDGTFHPSDPITRAEAMKIMNSVLNRGVNSTSSLGNPKTFPDNSDPSAWYYYEVLEATNDHEYTGHRPNENWTRNAVNYVYDIVKYERP